jgi:hypothetical protein
MYKIIGADGRQYGPVSAEQIRAWIEQNRVRPDTLLQREGSQDWNPLSSFPEFADALGAKAGPAGPPPIAAAVTAAEAEALATEIVTRDYQLDIGSCFSRSWDLVRQHFWLIVGASFVVGLIEGAVPILVGPCMGGLYFLFLKLIRSGRGEFSDAFAGFSQSFLQLFLAGLVSSLLISLGLVLCILPGIYLGVAWLFALPLVIDKKMDFWPAMELSRKVITSHWWVFLGLMLVGFLVGLLGLLVCCVGIYVAQPVVFGAIAFAYEDVIGRGANSRAPASS